MSRLCTRKQISLCYIHIQSKDFHFIYPQKSSRHTISIGNSLHLHLSISAEEKCILLHRDFTGLLTQAHFIIVAAWEGLLIPHILVALLLTGVLAPIMIIAHRKLTNTPSQAIHLLAIYLIHRKPCKLLSHFWDFCLQTGKTNCFRSKELSIPEHGQFVLYFLFCSSCYIFKKFYLCSIQECR